MNQIKRSRWTRTWLAALALCGVGATPVWAADCMALLPLFQQGGTSSQIAQFTGLSFAEVDLCRRELSRPLAVGPAGAPPVNAAGPPPVGAAGKPPIGAVGAPPMGAAGAPPVGSTKRRLQ